MRLDLYPDDLWSEILKKKKYIPRRLRKHEHLKLYKKYWIPYYGIIKVKDVINVANQDYYDISYTSAGNTLHGVIPWPLPYDSYEMLRNFDQIESLNFINKRKAVYGAEIKYWFKVNNIDFTDENYSGFLDKLQGLIDSTKYITRRNKKKKEYEFIKQ